MHCRLNPLEPVKEAAKTFKNHLWDILISTFLKVTYGPAECINNRIKTINICSHGFRNKDRLVDAICFHLGRLDLSRRV